MTKRAQIGMAMFLISETVLFFLLILAFAYFRAIPQIAPTGMLLTAALLASSFSMWRGWRWITIALGALFLAGQTGFFGTTFFTLAAVHGLHILAGLIALALVPVSALKVMALYWYFFTAVWMIIFVVASQA
jgi:heme/copper-type cytochrome/quinol oxidase subunit 3